MAGSGSPPTGHPFDVFLSHNSRDIASVERITEKLSLAGLKPWLDKWCLTAGANWQVELADGLRECAACVVFLGPSGLGDWVREELNVALDRAAKDRAFRVFLVLLPGLPDPFDAGALPSFLTTRTWVDLRDGLEHPRTFQRLLHAIRGIPLGPEHPVERRDDVCPYRGLQAFDEEHADFFFGRDADIQRAPEKLKGSSFLAVLGPSGSGKSSLVRAGVIPSLRNGALPHSGSWDICVLTPGARPLVALAAQLVRLHPQGTVQQVLDQLGTDLRTLDLTVAVALANRPASRRVLWVIDQFEEVFTLCADLNERAPFLANLLYATSVPDPRNRVVLTMRADFYAHCASHAELAARIAAQQLLVSPMHRDALRQAIEEPARRVGLEFEDGLVETILRDIERQPGALPLLEHALLELWDRRRGFMLTLEAYRESGGVEGAIAHRADAIFDDFTDDQKAIAKGVMLRLTQPGEGTEDTRRRALMSEFITRTDEEPAVETVVRKLADARLLTTTRDELTGERWADVSHEALIRGWPRLRQWIDDDRIGLHVHRRVTEAAHDWERQNRDEGSLYRGARLAEAVQWCEASDPALNQFERDFLQASQALRDRERTARERLRRRVTLSLAAGLLIALFLAGVAALQWRGAQREGEHSLARQLAAQAELLRSRPEGMELSTLLAAEGVRRLISTGRHSMEVDLALQRGLTLLPRPRATYMLESPTYVGALAFDGDGGSLTVASRGGDTQAWERSGGQWSASPDSPVSADVVALSPDGKFVAGAGDDSRSGIAHVREARSRGMIASFPYQGHVQSLSLSPGAKFLAMQFWDDSLASIWDVAGRRVAVRVPGRRTISFSPDGRYLAAGGAVWEIVTGPDATTLKEVSLWPRPRSALVDVVFSPDGRHVARADFAGHINVSNVGDWQDVVALEQPDVVGLLAISLGGSYVARADRDYVHVWETTSAREVARMPVGEVAALAFAPRGQTLVAGSGNSVVEWEIPAGAEVSRRLAPDTILAFDILPDGALATIGTSNAELVLRAWQLPELTEIVERTQRHPDRAFTLSADKKRWTVVTLADSLEVWEVDGRRKVASIGFDGGLGPIALSPSGAFAAIVTDQNRVRVWSVGSHQPVMDIRSPERVDQIGLNDEGSRLSARTARGPTRAGVPLTARVWAVPEGEETISFALNFDGTATTADSANTADENSGARLWNLETSRVGTIGRDALSPDGRHLATVSADSNTRVFHRESGEEMKRLEHGEDVHSVAFSADGKYLATLHPRNTIRIWLWRSEDLLALACTRVLRNLTEAEWNEFVPGRDYSETCTDQ